MRTVLIFALLVLGLVNGVLQLGCGAVSKQVAEANATVIDCTKGELANLKVIAPLVVAAAAATSDWAALEKAGRAAGERWGGCLFAYAHDELAAVAGHGFAASTSPPQQALERWRFERGAMYSYRTHRGEL